MHKQRNKLNILLTDWEQEAAFKTKIRTHIWCLVHQQQ